MRAVENDVDELDYETFEEATLMNVNLDDGDDPSSGIDDAQSALKKKKKSNAPKVGITVDPRPESERGAWYISLPAAHDSPEWRNVEVVNTADVAPGVRVITLKAETSRQMVARERTYNAVGQIAKVKIDGGDEVLVRPCSPPFEQGLKQREALFRLRHDVFAHQEKSEPDPDVSAPCNLELYVEQYKAPEVYALGDDAGALVEIGPFQGGGLNLKDRAAAVFLFPTVLIFASGDGIATAKALVESEMQAQPAQPLALRMRQQVHLFYKTDGAKQETEDGSLPESGGTKPHFEKSFSTWGQKCNVQVHHEKNVSLVDMFEDGDFAYHPATTVAIVLSESEEEEEELVTHLLGDGELSDEAVLSLRRSEQIPVREVSASKQV